MLTQTLPLDLAAAISELEAVEPEGAIFEDDLAWVTLFGMAFAGWVVVDSGAVAAGADFVVVAAVAAGVLAVASVELDFLLRLFLAVAASEVLATLVGVAEGVAVSAVSDFFLRLDFFVPAAGEVSALAELEVSVAPADLLLDFLAEVAVSPDAED